MDTNKLIKQIRQLPNNPGVYIFKDAQKKIVYIGKASNLKSRVGSYLPSLPVRQAGRQAGLRTEDMRIRKMVELAKSLKFVSTQSDIEALILESHLIKKFRPPFNIVMRDDKQYSFVVFTDEKFQKIFTTHQPQNHREIIGQFTDAGALKTTLRLLRRIFPYCTCKQLHNNFCLNYHIGKCAGFCCLKKQTTNNRQLTTYNKNIQALKEILKGKHRSLIRKLEKEMDQLAKNGNLEEAIELREKLVKLKRVFENARIIKNYDILKTHRSGLESLLKIKKPIIRIEGYDVSNIQGAHATGSMVTFVHGRAEKNFYRKFKIQKKQTPDLPAEVLMKAGDTAMLKEILERRFRHQEWPFPDLILIDGGKGQVNTAIKTLKKLTIKIPVIGISKNEQHIGHKLITCLPAGRYLTRFKIIPLTKLSPADKNLLLEIDSEAHRFAISYYRKLHRRNLKEI